MFLVTIWHTGTSTFSSGILKAIPGSHFRHVTNDRALDIARESDDLATTYRDPYRTAASWKNRERLKDHEWKSQWDAYRKVLEMNPKIFYCDGPISQHGIEFPVIHNTYKDRLGLHKALDDGDYKYYYRKVPKYLVDHALENIGDRFNG